jgi:flagellar biosynthesis protein
MNDKSKSTKTNLRGLLAIALRYKRETDSAPMVVAKGQGLTARKILNLAQENNVPIHEDPVLSQLMKDMDLDQPIPPELYEAVAKVLTFVYAVDRKVKNEQ